MRQTIRTLLVLSWFLCATSAHGELYVHGGLGASIVTGLPENGTWYQDGLASDKDRLSLGIRAGVGYRWGHWSIESGYVRLGSITNTGNFVDDQDYHAAARQCRTCENVAFGAIHGSMQVGDVTVGYTWNPDGLIRPRIRAGVFAGSHTVSFWNVYPYLGREQGATYQGMVGGAVGGAGVCAAWVCGDVYYYTVLTHTQYPFARDVIMPTLSLNIPLHW